MEEEIEELMKTIKNLKNQNVILTINNKTFEKVIIERNTKIKELADTLSSRVNNAIRKEEDKIRDEMELKNYLAIRDLGDENIRLKKQVGKHAETQSVYQYFYEHGFAVEKILKNKEIPLEEIIMDHCSLKASNCSDGEKECNLKGTVNCSNNAHIGVIDNTSGKKKRNGIGAPNYKKDSYTKTMVDLWNAGKTVEEIAKATKCSQKTVWNRFKVETIKLENGNRTLKI